MKIIFMSIYKNITIHWMDQDVLTVIKYKQLLLHKFLVVDNVKTLNGIGSLS